MVCWLPLRGICWEDEIPDIDYWSRIPEKDRDHIFRLFTIRVRIWKRVVLSEAEQQLWDTTLSQVPQWAFFKRNHVSADDQHAQEVAEQGGADVLEALLSDADEVRISENDGVQNFSATYDLTKGHVPPQKKQAWWERIFQTRRSAGE